MYFFVSELFCSPTPNLISSVNQLIKNAGLIMNSSIPLYIGFFVV